MFQIDLDPTQGSALSWSIASEARGQGLGKRMVLLGATMAPRPVRAEIRISNEPGQKIAAGCGMSRIRTQGDWETWGRAMSEAECEEWLRANP